MTAAIFIPQTSELDAKIEQAGIRTFSGYRSRREIDGKSAPRQFSRRGADDQAATWRPRSLMSSMIARAHV
jgi:hypothetical protein